MKTNRVAGLALGVGLALTTVNAWSGETNVMTTNAVGSVRIYSVEKKAVLTVPRVVRTEAEWKALLTPEQFQVARHGGTECAFTGALYKHHGAGVYRCVCCGTDLFRSDDKFESGTGWPSFFQPVHELNLKTVEDKSFGMVRKEIRCARCDAHLGHVFPDGPKPTGLRYCINSAALKFVAGP